VLWCSFMNLRKPSVVSMSVVLGIAPSAGSVASVCSSSAIFSGFLPYRDSCVSCAIVMYGWMWYSTTGPLSASSFGK